MLTQIQEQLARMELLNRITRAIGERLDLPSIFQVMAQDPGGQPAGGLRLRLPHQAAEAPPRRRLPRKPPPGACR